MAGEDVKLYGTWRSPYSRRVEIALKLKGVQHKYYEEDLTNKSPSLLKYNPVHKKIPVLVHGEKVISESHVILEYIDETWKGYDILPKDPCEKAKARFWARFIDEKCLPALKKALASMAEERDNAVEEACELLQLLENELKHKKYFGGDCIGLVDIVANFISHWLKVLQEVVGVELLTIKKFPKLCEWSENFVCHHAVKECLPPKDKLLTWFHSHYGSGTTSK
ncbi:putative glutathione transferase [Rosa chinensis]|uniref:glutathione transferase n=1 Tax=Rosa chinensis TaxID=74649 RepID=A0A2P6R9J5_ROSCH|nr:probable glutathione S-transferase [Rosa chinensis]PRQ43081.1 putative glutathione transferase [Rosa chinensis]